ncbi:methyltransferase domain-containing protein [Aureococcus anophagefferens]|nr:methyltransferase domain-containing protein [Aureococcus anophagefferens]
MLGDARDATAGDGAGVNRAALVPFSNVERRVKNVTLTSPSSLDKVRRIFDVKTLAWSAADSNYYSTAASAESASPVDKRASYVDEYKAHAKQIDVEINGVSDGPMLRALSSSAAASASSSASFPRPQGRLVPARGRRDRALRVALDLHGCACPDQAALSNELHREWGTTAAKYRARYLISGLKFVDGTWAPKARALPPTRRRRAPPRGPRRPRHPHDQPPLRRRGGSAATWLGSPRYPQDQINPYAGER